MRLVFNHLMFRHINEASAKEHGRASYVMRALESLLQYRLIVAPLALVEHVFGFLLALPIPLYSSVVYAVVTGMRGLPHFLGMYVRAIYYREKLGLMEANVFIDQGVFFAYPKAVELREFCFIDKNVIIMSRTAKIGRRVHIAPKVFISGGGDFEIEDYACIATNSSVITSTEVLKDGARCSGPMVTAAQRNVLRGKVIVRKDAFIGPNVTLLPAVTIGEGAVIGAGVTVAKEMAPWGIYVGSKAQLIGERQRVRWPSD
jgi:acetyltransferase-like isoleucine patch superfamily enzyme